MRKATVERRTTETDISVELAVEGRGSYEIDTGCGFFDHMLELFTRHGMFDLKVSCRGDTGVDYHHSVEDVGIALGSAFDEALSDRRGITRYGSALLPMDEALVMLAADISGRGMLCYDVTVTKEKVGDFDTELVKEFLIAFARNAGVTLHVRMISGENAHHIIEAVFKGLGRVMRACAAIDAASPDAVPSTKGAI